MPRERRRVRLEGGLNLRLPILMRQGLIVPGARVDASIRWTYTGSDIETGKGSIASDLTAPVAGWLDIRLPDLQQRIDLRSQPRHFGGRQWYFECPETGRLVTALWYPNGARRFASRHAWPRQVAYCSQFESWQDRAISGAFRIRRRLDPTGIYHYIGEFVPPKPKRMRWTTYEKLLANLRKYENACGEYEALLLGRLEG